VGKGGYNVRANPSAAKDAVSVCHVRWDIVLALAALWVALVAAACTQAAPNAPANSPSPVEPGGSPKPGLSPGLEQSGKPLPPVELSVRLADTRSIQQDGRGAVRLEIRPGVAVSRLNVLFEASGDAHIDGESAWSHSSLGVGQTVTAEAAIAFPRTGRGEVRGWVEGCDETGKTLFGVSRALYIIAMGDRILSGDSSFLALELAELDRQLAAGEVSRGEYQQKRQAVLSGGAKETIIVTPPGGSPSSN